MSTKYKDILYFNQIHQAYYGRKGQYYRIPFDTAPITDRLIEVGNKIDLDLIGERMTRVINSKGYSVIEINWQWKFVMVYKGQ